LEYENGGTYCYYVQVIPQYGDNAVYTLPGQIRVEVDEYDDGEKRHYNREYFIEKVFFDDGTYLDFTNNGEDTTLTGSVTLEDQYEEEWKCTIINEHAYSSEFKETTHVTTYGVLECLQQRKFGCFYPTFCRSCRSWTMSASKMRPKNCRGVRFPMWLSL
jgi:hypothetical protein